MSKLNYPTSSAVIRNLADVPTEYTILCTRGRFRIIRFSPPFFSGYEFWVVNEKGFLWEPADTYPEAEEYLETDEAREYQE